MKDKNLAAILAFFGGQMGLHRFYLGQPGLAFFYFVPLLGAFIGLIDAISFLSMSEETFNTKYNMEQYRTITNRTVRSSSSQERERRYQKRQQEREVRERARRQTQTQRQPRQRQRQRPPAAAPRQRPQPNDAGTAERKAGLRYFRDFEYDRAIKSFSKAVQLNPQDIASHFNLAASYSCEEDADKAFYHLDRAVALGFRDFERIRAHDSFAFLRIQPEFPAFAENDFRLTADLSAEEKELNKPVADEEMVELPEINDDLLDQLQRLATLKEKGLLTEIEFSAQKKRLLG